MHATQEMSRIKGLFKGNPRVGWGLMLGSIAIVGMPPFGVFSSEFLILTATIKQAPWLTGFLLLGLCMSFAGIMRKVQSMVCGEIPPNQTSMKAAHVPVMVHLAIVCAIGIYIPVFLNTWFQKAVELLK